MNGKKAQQSVCPEEIRVLIFRAGGIRMGVDASDITEIIDREQAESRALKPFRLIDGAAGGNMGGTDSSINVLVTRKEGLAGAILIERPEDILTIPMDDLQPLPPLIASCGSSRALWGALVRNDEVILLLDIDKLASVPDAGGG
jgi:chemotaxis signal transduction protein